jgi:hypothetical protein
MTNSWFDIPCVWQAFMSTFRQKREKRGSYSSLALILLKSVSLHMYPEYCLPYNTWEKTE